MFFNYLYLLRLCAYVHNHHMVGLAPSLTWFSMVSSSLPNGLTQQLVKNLCLLPSSYGFFL